jgi:parvulin-like peptidyl-prolyl isomerase
VRQRAAQEGIDFEELKRRQFRLIMVEIYRERRVRPLIHVNADDMRRYYQQNIRSYSVAAAAQFRVIKIDFERSGGRGAAETKAKRIREQAQSGEDFATLAGKTNDDPLLMRTGGAVGENGWMEKGAYAIDPVEAAIWTLRPGEVTPPIEAGNAFYVAKLETLRPARVKPFESQEVQEQIYSILSRQQSIELTSKRQQDLERDSLITRDQNMEGTMMAMIMQKYAPIIGK